MFSHEKLKKRRVELNLTQSSIYQELGISRKTYSAWENGLAEPHAKISGGWPPVSRSKRTTLWMKPVRSTPTLY